jgi:hypothetical protein
LGTRLALETIGEVGHDFIVRDRVGDDRVRQKPGERDNAFRMVVGRLLKSLSLALVVLPNDRREFDYGGA